MLHHRRRQFRELSALVNLTAGASNRQIPVKNGLAEISVIMLEQITYAPSLLSPRCIAESRRHSCTFGDLHPQRNSKLPDGILQLECFAFAANFHLDRVDM
jgi:hypothetical protein